MSLPLGFCSWHRTARLGGAAFNSDEFWGLYLFWDEFLDIDFGCRVYSFKLGRALNILRLKITQGDILGTRVPGCHLGLFCLI